MKKWIGSLLMVFIDPLLSKRLSELEEWAKVFNERNFEALGEVRAENLKIEASIQLLSKDCNNMSDEMKKAIKALDEKIANIGTRIIQINGDLEDVVGSEEVDRRLKDQYDDLDERIVSLEDANSYAEKVEEMYDNYEALDQSALEDLITMKDELSTLLDDSGDFDELKDTVNELVAKVENLESELDASKEKIKVIKADTKVKFNVESGIKEILEKLNKIKVEEN